MPTLASSFRLSALAVFSAIGALTFSASGHAADLGGNCCADLEERIAELEATTARKGNRKVSLTISGYVAQEITYWNDGGVSNVYLHGLGPTQATHVKLTGQAKITPSVTAGYVLRIQNLTDDPFSSSAVAGAMNQFSDNAGAGLNVQMSYWYLQDKDLGKLSVGRQANAAKSAAMFTDQSGTQVFDNYTFLGGFPQFIIRSQGDLVPASLTWGQLGFCYAQNLPIGGDCNGIVMNGVRYDSPTIAGFTMSASWGENDFWEVAGRYNGEVQGFKISLGVGYGEYTDEGTTGPKVLFSKHTDVFQAGGYVQHIATGLFLHGAYGLENNNNAPLLNGFTAPDSNQWYVKAGVRQKWTPFGATIIYGDYADYIDQLGPAALALGATSSDLQRYGGGIAQEFDAAAMTLYVKYQHYDGSLSGVALNPAATGLDGLDLVSAGGLINF